MSVFAHCKKYKKEAKYIINRKKEKDSKSLNNSLVIILQSVIFLKIRE